MGARVPERCVSCDLEDGWSGDGVVEQEEEEEEEDGDDDDH